LEMKANKDFQAVRNMVENHGKYTTFRLTPEQEKRQKEIESDKDYQAVKNMMAARHLMTSGQMKKDMYAKDHNSMESMNLFLGT
jgi:hypothetical protein